MCIRLFCSTTIVCLAQFWSWYLDIPSVKIHQAINSFALRKHSSNMCSKSYAEIRDFSGDFCFNVIRVSFNCVNQSVIQLTRGGSLPHESKKFKLNGYHGTERGQSYYPLSCLLNGYHGTERGQSYYPLSCLFNGYHGTERGQSYYPLSCLLNGYHGTERDQSYYPLSFLLNGRHRSDFLKFILRTTLVTICITTSSGDCAYHTCCKS